MIIIVFITFLLATCSVSRYSYVGIMNDEILSMGLGHLITGPNCVRYVGIGNWRFVEKKCRRREIMFYFF